MDDMAERIDGGRAVVLFGGALPCRQRRSCRHYHLSTCAVPPAADTFAGGPCPRFDDYCEWLGRQIVRVERDYRRSLLFAAVFAVALVSGMTWAALVAGY